MTKKFTLVFGLLIMGALAAFSQCTPTSLSGNQVISSNTTWNSGTYNINGDFTVSPGVTLTISYNNNCPLIINAHNISIFGTLNADGAGGAGGAGGGAGSSSGGAGGGSQAAGGGGGSAGQGTGGGPSGGSGSGSTSGCSIDCGNFVCSGGNDADRAGGGGGAGGAGGSHGGVGGAGGFGAAGRVENVPSNSRCGSPPVAGAAGTGFSAASSYANTPTNADLPTGSGGGGAGGGGGGFGSGTAGGAGGYGGGGVNLNASGNLNVSGVISASGTTGGNGGNGGVRSGDLGDWNCENCGNSNGGGSNDCRNASLCGACTYYTWGWPGGGGAGGGGGSGGSIKLQAKGNFNLTGTLLANGGNGGNAGRPWTGTDGSCNHDADAGGAGAGGVITYVYNPCATNTFNAAAAQVNPGTPGTSGSGSQGGNIAAAGIVYTQSAHLYPQGYNDLPPTVASSNQVLCGAGHTAADIVANGIMGGIGTYSYQWYVSTTNPNGQSGNAATPATGWSAVNNGNDSVLTSATIGTLNTTHYYQFQVISGPCNSWSNVVAITVTTLPSITNAAAQSPSCNGGNNGSLIIVAGNTGTAPITYSIDGGTTYQSSNTFSGLTAGTYNLYVSDANNCVGSFAQNPVTVTEPAALSMTDSIVNASCVNVADGSVTVTQVTGGTSPYTYSIDGGTSGSNNAFTGLAGTTTYLVQVTDNNGCIDTMSAYVDNSYSVSASTDSTTAVSCNGGNNGTATVSLSGGVTPYWYSIGGSNYQLSPTLTGLSAGSYTATLKDANGCTATTPVQITEPTAVVVSIDSVSSIPCNSAALGKIYSSTTGGTPGYAFLWSNGDTAQNIANLAGGAYTITATDNNSCTATASATILVVSDFTATVSSTPANCFGETTGSVTINVTSGTSPFSYLWSNGDTTSTADSVAAGSYSVTVTDGNNCQGIQSGTVTEPTVVSAQASAVQPTCAGANNGEGIATAGGGTSGYTYLWSNTVTTDTATGLAPGNYSVVVTDAHNCSASASITITDPAALQASITPYADSCFGDATGSAQAAPAGGTSPFTYVWSNGSTGGYVTGLVAGPYTVTITDRNNCSSTATTTVTQPTQMQVYTSTTPAVDANSNGTATVDSVTGGTPPYFIPAWSDNQTTNPAVDLAAGTYTVTVVDHNGCQQTGSATVTSISGIATVTNDLSFNIYPNPAKTELNIGLNDVSREGVITVSIKDVLGHTLLTKTITAPHTAIDLLTFAAGVYAVEVSRNGKKVVKQVMIEK